MFKSKISERVQEVILPDFPDDENTVPTVTKSRRVSFGTNFVKEFIVGSAVSVQSLPEYEQAFPSSDSSTADSSHSAVESMDHSMFVPPPHDIHKVHKPVPTVSQLAGEPDFVESRPKLPKFSSTVCFSADSPTADMEFTEGCITLAKSILDKKNKEMTVIIQAKPKDEEKPKEEETKYFDGSQFEMSMTRCLKSKGNKREERRFESEKTKIFSKYENEMSITRCNRIFTEDDSDASWEDCKENRMPLDMIMRHLDKENSDLENDLFNPEKNFDNFFNTDALDLTNESEKLNLNESMDISTDFQFRGPRNLSQQNAAEILIGKSTQVTTSPEVAEKSMLGATIADDGINKSAKDLSLEEDQPFKMAQSPPKTDNTINKSVLQECKEDSIPEAEPSIPPTIEDDKINRSTQQLSLAMCVEPGPMIVEPTVTDQKVRESLERNESEEVVRESMALDQPTTDKITEERSREDQPTNDFKSNTPNEEMRSNVVFTPEKEVAEEPVVEETNKSPDRMSLDESNVVLPSGIVESLTDTPSNAVMNKSAHRNSLGETEDIVREQSLMELTSTDKINESVGPKLPSAEQISVSMEPKVVELPSVEQTSLSMEPKVVDKPLADKISSKVEHAQQKAVDLTSTDQINVSVEPKMVDPPPADEISSKSPEQMVVDMPPTDKRKSTDSLDETEREPSLVDLKVIESLIEQSKEAGCVWSLKDLRHPQNKSQGWLAFNCKLLESTSCIQFRLKTTNEDSPVACSIVTDSEIAMLEENQLQLPEYRLVIDFGFGELKKYFEERRTQVETIRHVPYFLDQFNLFLVKMNGCLRQMHSVLTMYPGSRLEGSRLSFRLFSFPIFFSSTVSIDLSNYFRLSKSSLSFNTDLGSLDENRIGMIFEDCLKRENSLCEFIVQSTKYIIDLEKESGYVSKRGHIRLLPSELKL